MDELVYHYTDANALLGILRKGELWCTHISYLNDSLEYKLSLSLYGDVLRAISKESHEDPLIKEFASEALRIHEYPRSSRSILVDRWRYFVACFSTKDDDLSLWRGYTSSGPKFCLAFKKAELAKLDDLRGFKFSAVSYDTESAKATIRADFLEQARLYCSRVGPDKYERSVQMIIVTSYYAIEDQIMNKLSPTLKDPSFEDESEYRLYSVPDGGGMGRHKLDYDYRVGKSFLVPFAKLSLAGLESPLHSIRVGPTPHPEESIAAVKRLLSELPVESPFSPAFHLPVIGSSIPYRDW